MYESRITESKEQGFYALIVRVDSNGEENVIYGYKGRFFKTRTGAEKSTLRHVEKYLR